MNDLINREEAIKAIMDIPDGNWTSEKYADAIKELPTAERTGKWIFNLKGSLSNMRIVGLCNKCGEHGFPQMKYCPSCGARMKGEVK